mmetsp:Transcript_1131/g.2035  ORF Transcript_1131/g.2035 Transcript_1131/m.2035 type:complete len:207 (+) Transcript_1131:252-872(+)
MNTHDVNSLFFQFLAYSLRNGKTAGFGSRIRCHGWSCTANTRRTVHLNQDSSTLPLFQQRCKRPSNMHKAVNVDIHFVLQPFDSIFVKYSSMMIDSSIVHYNVDIGSDSSRRKNRVGIFQIYRNENDSAFAVLAQQGFLGSLHVSNGCIHLGSSVGEKGVNESFPDAPIGASDQHNFAFDAVDHTTTVECRITTTFDYYESRAVVL